MSRVRRALLTAAFYAGVALFGVMCLLWSLPAGLLYHVLPRRVGAPLGRAGISAGFRLYLAAMRATGQFHTDLGALDALRDAGPLIIAANHPSLLDAVLVISRLPRIVCITKASLWDNWFLGGGIRLAGYIRNDSPRALARRGIAELRAGQQLLIFPEGTRTAGAAPVDRFRGGFVIMARQAPAPVQTVLIGGSRYLAKGWPLFRRPEFPLAFHARLGRRFDVAGPTQAFTDDLQSYFERELAAVGGRRDRG